MRYLVLGLLAMSGAESSALGAQQEGPRTAVETGAGGSTPQRIRSVTLAPGERCPPSSGEEVVVCYQGGSPYRIPPQLRDGPGIPAANQSWVNRAATIDQTNKVAGGLPDTCSAVGTGGQSGCAQAQLRAWAADRAARAREERVTPGGEDE
jgi:hypothetical protein